MEQQQELGYTPGYAKAIKSPCNVCTKVFEGLLLKIPHWEIHLHIL